MRREDLIKGLHGLKELEAEEWRQAVEMYPTCEMILWHYLLRLYRDDDISFERELMRLGLRLSDREGFYRFMTQRKVENAFPELAATSGDWFDAEEKRSDTHKATLVELARKLKAERLAEREKREAQKSVSEGKKEAEPSESSVSHTDKEMIIRELISRKKYSEALEILRSINLSNSKKSTTFAVQIKWLETIINNK